VRHLATLVPVVGIRLVRLVLRLLLVRLLVDVPVHPTHGGGTLVPGGLAQGAPWPTVTTSGAGGTQRTGRRSWIDGGWAPVATLVEAPTRVANRSVAASPGHGKGLDRRLGCCHVREVRLGSSHVRFMWILWAFRRRRLAGLLQGTSSIRRLAIELHGQCVPVGVPWHG